MKTLADFKRYAQPGAMFLRRFPGTDKPASRRMVVIARTNSIVFPPHENYPLHLVADAPERNGSWFYWPKASACRIENGTLTVFDREGRDYISLTPVIGE